MRINFRFMAMFLVACVAILCAVFVVHYFQTRRSATEMLAAARLARDEDRIAEAVPLYAKYIGMVPDSAIARQEVGMVLADVGEFERAFFHLEAAVRMDPEQTEARKKLVEVAVSLQRFNDARTHLTEVLLPAEPENAELVWQLAKCAWGDSDFATAQQLLEKAHQLQPEDSRIALDLAILLTEHQGNAEQARAVLDETVVAADEEALSYTARGRWLLSQSERPRQADVDELLAGAWQDAQKSVELDGTDVGVVLFAVDAALAVEELDAAERIIQRGMQANPQVPDMYARAAQVALRQGHADEAIEYFRAGLRAVPGQADLMWNLAQLELESGELETVDKLLSELRTAEYPEGPVRFLEAAAMAQRGQWQEAINRIESSKSLMQGSRDLRIKSEVLLAECYRELGNRDAQLAALDRAVSDSPGWSSTREALAKTLLQDGRTSEALSEYRLVLGESNPPVSALLGLAHALFESEVGRERPNWAELQRVLGILETAPSAASEVSVLKAAMLVRTGDKKAAEELLSTELQDQPSNNQLWWALISVHQQDQDWEKVEQVIKQAKQQMDDSLALRMVQASYLIQRYGNQVDRGRLEDLAEPLPDWSNSEKTQLALSFARAFWALGDYERCQKYGSIAAASPLGRTNLSLHLLMFDVGMARQDEKLIAETLERVNEIEGHGPLWRIGEASRLRLVATKLGDDASERKTQLLDEASSLLQDAATARPKWSRIPALAGLIYEERGREEQALSAYLKAIDLGETAPNVISNSLKLLFKQRRFVQANEVLRKIQEQNVPFSAELSRVASQVSLQLGDFDQALNLAKQWAQDSDQASDHSWLAQVYAMTGKTAEAEVEFRRAIELDPTFAEAWVSLVQMYARMDDMPAAKKVIVEAEQALTGDRRFDAIAQCYQSIGEFGLAEENYKKAVSQRPNDSEVQRRFAEFYLQTDQGFQALPLLERLVAGASSGTGESDTSWARRNLALVLASTGDAADSARAQKLLDINLRNAADNADDRRTMAIVLANRRDATSIDQAIKLLTELTSTAPKFSVPDNFLLAQLYARKKAWRDYNGTMRSVLSNGGANDPMYVSEFLKSLLEQGNLAAAEPWITRLKGLTPARDTTVDSIEVEYLLKTKAYKPLLNLLQDRAEIIDSMGWAAEMSEIVAAHMKREGNTSSSLEPLLKIAENAYGKLSEQEPKQGYLLAGFFAGQARHAEAIQLMDEHEYLPSQVAQIARKALEADELKEQDVQAYVDRVKQVLARNPDQFELALSLGDLHAWGGQWEQAADVYQQVLKSDPENIPALNNLAMVLAYASQRPADARQAIERAIALVGAQHFLLDTRGMVLMAAGDLAAAEQDFRQAIAANPRPDYFFHLAQNLLLQKRDAEAQTAFEQARTGGVSHQTVHSQERPAFEMLTSRLSSKT